jgi:hypothetical protein
VILETKKALSQLGYKSSTGSKLDKQLRNNIREFQKSIGEKPSKWIFVQDIEQILPRIKSEIERLHVGKTILVENPIRIDEKAIYDKYGVVNFNEFLIRYFEWFKSLGGQGIKPQLDKLSMKDAFGLELFGLMNLRGFIYTEEYGSFHRDQYYSYKSDVLDCREILDKPDEPDWRQCGLLPIVAGLEVCYPAVPSSYAEYLDYGDKKDRGVSFIIEDSDYDSDKVKLDDLDRALFKKYDVSNHYSFLVKCFETATETKNGIQGSSNCFFLEQMSFH